MNLKSIALTMFIVAFTAFSSCEDPVENGGVIATVPIAAFTSTMDANDWKTYTFVSTSTNATTYFWDFDDTTSGDSNTATGETASHTFSAAGTYEVLLTAKDERGASSTALVRIAVSNPNGPNVTAAFTSTEDTNDWMTYSFTNQSENATEYIWDFGDPTSGSNTSTEAEPTHTFSGEGSFIVTLSAKNGETVEMVKEELTLTNPVATATFAAALLNGTFDDFDTDSPNTGNHKDDNNDAWEPDPNNSLKDGSASPYKWENAGLKGLGKRAAGMTTSQNNGNYAIKFDGDERRAYQPFAVEVGVEYTITMWVRAETTNDFTVYILNNEVQDETNLAGNSDKVFVVSDGDNSYKEYSFAFVATTTQAVFYAVGHVGINGDSEVYLDDISIATPGFESMSPDAITPAINDGGFNALRVYSDGSAADGLPDFNGKTSIQGSSNAWKIGSFTDGNTNPYSSTSDGLDKNYDGTDYVDNVVTDGKDAQVSATQTKSRAAKWDTGGTKNQQANADGTPLGPDSRYAYQALTVTPNTSYTVTFWYAFEKSIADQAPSTGSLVVEILDGHFTDGADAIAATPIDKIVGDTPSYTSNKEYKQATGTFTSNSSGDISLWIYATSTVADNDVFIDNIHVVPTP